MWSSLKGWFTSTLQWLGLYGKNGTFLLLGLDNAGKTTLMHLLHNNRLIQHVPTHHPTAEDMTMGGVTFKAIDLGGHKEARRLWKDYFTTVDAIIFIVDASDRERAHESKACLHALLVDETIQYVPILVLGNKIDMEGAMSEQELREVFGLMETTGKHNNALPVHTRALEVYMCAVVERMGYGDGIRWLADKI